MPFSKTADGIFDAFKSPIQANGQPGTIPAVTMRALSPAPPQALVDSNLYVTSDFIGSRFNPIVTKLFLRNTMGTTLQTLEREELRQFFSFVERNNDSNYRNVKTNQVWRTTYGVQVKAFDTYNSKTNAKGIKSEDATYCVKCTVVLPLRNLTIDHQKPQKGGEIEAMLRVFRSLGLTIATGSGQKNRYLQRQHASIVGGNQTVRARGDRGSESDRYSLDDKGALYFSVLSHFQLLDEMKGMSMHHVTNLRPMCGPCNSSLRNTNVTFIW